MKNGMPLPAVLDMGNSRFRVLVGEGYPDGSLKVIAAGEADAKGMDDGSIVDLSAAAAALRSAVRRAEMESGRDIKQVFAAVSGEYIKSYECKGQVLIEGAAPLHDMETPDDSAPYEFPGRIVGKNDVRKVRQLCVAAVLPSGAEALEVHDKTFAIDRQQNIRNPLGMRGRVLSGEMRLIAAEQQSLENLAKCINAAGVSLAGQVVFSGAAAARAVLNEEEKRLGVCLLDIGAQTSELVIFYNSGIYAAEVYLEAANLLHADISAVHHTTLASAERVKRQVGVLMPQTDNALLQMDSTSGDTISVEHSLILRTTASRVEQLLELLRSALEKFDRAHGRKLTGGVVITGGGALLPGLAAMINHRLQIPARVGLPAYNGDKADRVKTPHYAAALGLLMIAGDRARALPPLSFSERLKNFFFQSFHPEGKKNEH